MTSEEYKAKFKKKDKVCIVGFADSKDLAPYKDDSYEIWGLNSLFEQIPRYDIWFEIHDRKVFNIDTNKEIGLGLTREGKPYLGALAQLKCPVFMCNTYPDIPNSQRYPLEEMITKFDPAQKKIEWKEFPGSHDIGWNGYFTNSISYMLALAIDWGYSEIAVYGVDMATATEYNSQRPSCEYYLGVAAGKGIKVVIPPQADLLKARYLYGWEDEKINLFGAKVKKTMESMQQRLHASQQQKFLSQKQEDQYIGALECAKELLKIWG